MPLKDLEARRVYEKLRREKNREALRAYNREYSKNHREKLREQQKAWVAAHPEAAKEHAARYNLKLYGLNLEEYEAQLKAQDGKCAICRRTPEEVTKNGKVRKFAQDHCHKTGKRRGLLCYGCNVSIGHLGDSVEGVQRALAYLQQFQS